MAIHRSRISHRRAGTREEGGMPIDGPLNERAVLDFAVRVTSLAAPCSSYQLPVKLTPVSSGEATGASAVVGASSLPRERMKR